MPKIDSFPGKVLGLLADLHLKLHHGSHTVEQLEKFVKGEPVFCDMFTMPVDHCTAAKLPKLPGGYTPKLMDRELHFSGPSKLGFSRIALWYHEGQLQRSNSVGRESVDSLAIYEHLKSTGMLTHCLSFCEGEAIAQHLKHFPSQWKGKRLLLWKSVVHDGDIPSHLYVPSLCESESNGKIELGWEYMAAYPAFMATALYV